MTSYEIPPATIADEDIKQTITADIVIIGAGTAGLVTAMTAAEAGASVVVIAKSPSVSARGGSNFAIGSKLAKQLGQEFDWHAAYEKLLGLHTHRVNEQLWSIFANKSGEAMDWMCEKAVAAGLTPVLQHPMVGEYPGTHMFLGGPHGQRTSGDPQFDILLYLVDAGKQLGTKFLFNTRAEQLVRENDGRVSAVIAKTRDGSYTKFVGKKAVVLATGDYSSDSEMKAKYCPMVQDLPSHVAPQGSCSGDGHKMARWVGAGMQKNEWHAPMIFGTSHAANAGRVVRQNADDPEAVRDMDTMLAHGCDVWNLNVNALGERYCNENIISGHHAMQTLLQPGKKVYAIWDSGYAEKMPNTEPYVGAPRPDAKRIQRAFDILAKANIYFKANTIEELAEKFKLPTDTFLETVARYNQLCKDGNDTDFGKPKELLFPIEQAPFYASECIPSLLSVVGGLRNNTKMQVLDEQDQVIPGLYAIGTVSGDFFANAYTTHFPGHNLGRCITFGYLAGKYIAKGC